MAQSIGIDYTPGQWKVCQVERGQTTALHVFNRADDMLETMRQLCAHYPEQTIAVSLDVSTPFLPLSTLSDEQLEALVQRYHPTPAFLEVTAALRALRALSSRSYCAPSVEYVPTVPLYRYLLRPALGNARELCVVATLLHYMCEQRASWEEMNFFCVNASESGTSVLVVVNGQVVNGIDVLQGSTLPVAYAYLADLESRQESVTSEEVTNEALQQALDEAFWEGLTQELSGLLAIHHLEDIVVLGQRSSRLVERLADSYQVYLFPHAHTEREGYEAALGAALLAEGLEKEGSSAAVVERLHIRQATRKLLISNP
jgi:predicted butyrate kinase (DUF1464 family)